MIQLISERSWTPVPYFGNKEEPFLSVPQCLVLVHVSISTYFKVMSFFVCLLSSSLTSELSERQNGFLVSLYF